ncbi:MAG: SHOCT domain-containing protein [Thermoleophilia bacterium]|nr:SHOCT domain-containing protein [Thermoleophilia bacterium]
MTQFDEEFGKRAEDLRKVAADMSREFRKVAADLHEQMQVFADDLRRRARGDAPFDQSAIEKIRALAQLRDEGILTDEEFQAQKQRLLDQV